MMSNPLIECASKQGWYMSNAKAILAERLAKGEITEEDYDRLISKLDDNASVSFTTDTSPIQTTPPLSSSPPVTKSSTSLWDIIKGFAAIGFCVFIFIIYPMRSKANDLDDTRNQCRRISGVNCECVVRKTDDRFSFFAYMPLVRYFARPSESDVTAIMTQFIRDCRT